MPPRRTENRERRTESARQARDGQGVAQGGASRRPIRPISPICPTALSEAVFSKTTETQGMGTVVRTVGTNGEVPRPSRSFGVFVENHRRRRSSGGGGRSCAGSASCHGGEDAAAELRVKPRLSLLAFAQGFGAEGLDDGLPLRLGLRVACDGLAIRFHDNSVAYWKFGSLEAWKFGFVGGAPPHTPAEKVWKLGFSTKTRRSARAWAQGAACAAPENGKRRTENREQRARGKRAMGKALYRAASAAVLFLLPHRLRAVFLGKRQGAKRRATGAVSGGAAERPMEPEAVRAPCCVFAVRRGAIPREGRGNKTRVLKIKLAPPPSFMFA